MLEYTYLFLNIFCIVGALFLIYTRKVKFDLKAYLKSVLLVSIPFIVWDYFAVHLGHWSFNESYIIGIYIANLAVEEVMFFLTVPLVMSIIFKLGSRKKGKIVKSKEIVLVLFLLGLTLLILSSAVNSYTFIVSIVYLISIAILRLKYTSLFKSASFWYNQIFLFSLFVIFNTILTALPIIEYGEGYYLGFRIGTIPIEDFFFNFALINLFALSYLSFSGNSEDARKVGQ